MDQEKIVEITTIEELIEMSSMGGGGVGVSANTGKKKDNKMISRKKLQEEQIFRKYIRQKLKRKISEVKNPEDSLRLIIRQLLKEGDLSDTHPHRSTGINTLEDVLN